MPGSRCETRRRTAPGNLSHNPREQHRLIRRGREGVWTGLAGQWGPRCRVQARGILQRTATGPFDGDRAICIPADAGESRLLGDWCAGRGHEQEVIKVAAAQIKTNGLDAAQIDFGDIARGVLHGNEFVRPQPAEPGASNVPRR